MNTDERSVGLRRLQLDFDRRLAQAKHGRQVVDVELPDELPDAADVGPDLRRVPPDELSSLDGDALELAVQRVMHQVERPRTNLGNSGPPGRVD